jgi:hypothetical protein
MPLMPLQFQPADQFVKLCIALLYSEGAIRALARGGICLISNGPADFLINALKAV